MESAKTHTRVAFSSFDGVECGIIKWPMSVVRLSSDDTDALVELADRILTAWRGYSDPALGIFAETDGTPHNTVTPIARRRGDAYELDLVLRNNITTDEHPLGVFHPHAEHHNIKKENIGLIEVMGLAVLPARLKDEIEIMKRAIDNGEDFAKIPEIEKHKAWFDAFKDKYTLPGDDVEGVIRTEIGNTFVRVLSDAGVYKDTDEGRSGFLRFLATVGGREID